MWDDLIGRRVVIRRRVDAGGEHPRFSDVLGTLMASTPALQVKRSDGEVTTILPSEVHRIKAVPPPRVRVVPSSITPLALEEIAAKGWPAPATARIGRWLLRAADGWTRRANSVLPLGSPGMPHHHAITAAKEWYAERGLPLRFQIPVPGAEQLDEVLAAEHFLNDAASFMHVAPVGAVLANARPRPSLPPVDLQERPNAAWLEAFGASSPVAGVVLTGPRLPAFATVEMDGQAVGIARAVVDFDWLGITAVQVAPEYRRHGIGTHLMRAVAAWGRSNGARHSYLQVTESNKIAVNMYEQLGYVMHHEYHYRLGLP